MYRSELAVDVDDVVPSGICETRTRERVREPACRPRDLAPHCLVEVDLVEILLPKGAHRVAGGAGPQVSVSCRGALSSFLCSHVMLRGSGLWRVRDGLLRASFFEETSPSCDFDLRAGSPTFRFDDSGETS